MHCALLVIADGSKTLDEIMAPFRESYDRDDPHTEFVEDGDCDVDPDTGRHGYWANPNAKWDWYTVGGGWYGLIEANVGGHGMRTRFDFAETSVCKTPEDYADAMPYDMGGRHFDVARVGDILNPLDVLAYDVLTPDGVWHARDERSKGRDGRRERDLRRRLLAPNPNCTAIVVDYHC